jgi:signal transduction histidine kinase
MIARDGSGDTETWLVDLPATPRQQWSALAVAAALLLIFAILAPFTAVPLPRIDAFIPSLEAMVFVTDFITSVLLFALFSIYHSRALLVLAGGYLFTALIVIPHALTFPGAFSPTGLLGAGLQSTAWLWIFWHAGFPAAMLAYAWLRSPKRKKFAMHTPGLPAIGWSVVIVVTVVCGLTWLAIAGDEFLPRLFLDRARPTMTGHYTAISMIGICAVATAALWPHRHYVLDQWLMVVGLAWILEMAFTALFINPRFSLGFYAGRSLSLVTSTVVLAVLLAETTRLYARLARSNMMLQRERNNKLMNLEAVAASISHEVRQPLTAISSSASAARRFLGHVPPNLEEIRLAQDRVISDSFRASQILDNIRALFGRGDQAHEPVDVNEIVLGVLSTLGGELKDHNIMTRTELTNELPLVMGHRGQLQEVLLNLVRNAIEAMETIKDGRRLLLVRTERHGHDEIVVEVEDSGPGIDPKDSGKIFEAFITTKAQGMGLGLAMCRMIIERHGGQLSALSSERESGALFQFILPIRSAAGSTAAPR